MALKECVCVWGCTHAQECYSCQNLLRSVSRTVHLVLVGWSQLTVVAARVMMTLRMSSRRIASTQTGRNLRVCSANVNSLPRSLSSGNHSMLTGHIVHTFCSSTLCPRYVRCYPCLILTPNSVVLP